MKFNNWGVFGVSAVVLAGVVGSAVVAQTVQNARSGVSDMREVPFARIFSPDVLRSMKITPDQRQKIRQILQTDRPGFVPLLANAHSTGTALREGVEANEADADLQKLATSQADADLAVIVAAEKTQAEIAGVLTADQLAVGQKAIDTRIAMLRGHVAGGDGVGAARLDTLGDKLGATDAQKAQAKQIIESARAATQASTLTLLDSLKATEDSIASGTFDTAASQSAAQQDEGPLSTIVLSGAKTRAQLLALLTPDQKAKLKALMAQRREEGYTHRHAQSS